MTNLKLFWLGLPIIERDNTAIHMETRKSTALLAFLGLSTTPQSRESLATLLWPEFDQSHALANLRRILFSINKLIGPEILTITRENVGINPNFLVWQDVSEYHRLLETVKSHQHSDNFICPECRNNLEKAVILYRGDFLEGLNLRDCPTFDDWQYLEREVFRADLASTLEKLALAYSSNGDWEKAILMTRQWVKLDHLNEHAQRMLIQIFALAGQRSAALHQYKECTRWLLDELGQAPEEETVTLFNKVQNGEIGKSIEHIEIAGPKFRISLANQPLIKTKLFIPPPPTSLISRPNLFAKLELGAQRAITLISAPAGYGKTTLLSEWINTRQKKGASSPWTICWYSLDVGDNDPIRFLTYLTAALEKVLPGAGAEARSLLQSSPSLNPNTPLSMLINDLQELPGSVSLVLDDYQFINNPTIHDGVIFLLEHMPKNLHIVIATRSDPPLPLARFRSRNQLNELRANDLRFTSDEAALFLKKIFDLSLTAEQISVLDNRTEGWIAGLQMAAISMQGCLDINQFIKAFSGTHRFIIDYLAEEALNRQSIATMEFLLQTSILERLSEPLCDFVLDKKPSKEIDILSSTIEFSTIQSEILNPLKELEISNLFIVTLDDERIWYRYHHLFADLLRSRLEQISPELIPILHIRASAWFEKNGWIEESITHSLAARDWENATRLITNHVPAHIENGQMATILKWIDGLPEYVIFQNPFLCEQVADVYAHAGMFDRIDPFLNRAEELISARENHEEGTNLAQEWSLSQKEVTIIRSMIAILRGLKSFCSNEPNQALIFIHKALTDIPEMVQKELAVLLWVEGCAYRSLGNLNHALDSLTRALEYALDSGAILHDILTDLANVTMLEGKLPQAIDFFTNSLQIAADRGFQNQGYLSRDESFLSFIFLEQNQLDLALAHANRAIAYTQWWPSHNIIAIAYTSLAQILLARGDPDGSMLAIQKADQERKNWLMTPLIQSLVDMTWAQIWLKQNNWNLLDQWSDRLISTLNAIIDESKSIDEYIEMRLIMLVRVWMEKTKIDKNPERNGDCLRLLDRLENSSQTAGRINSLVEILILTASILFSQRKTAEAIIRLDNCLSMAEPGGYMRIFLNTGKTAHALLSAYLQNSKLTHKAYALTILKAFGGASRIGSSQFGIPESITSREMDVLHLLTEGCSNRQIAERLVLAEGTIKFHVHNLLEKLQVDSRTQAIARAKDLDLI